MPESAVAAPPAAPAAPSLDIPQPAGVQQPFNDAFADLDKMVSEAEPPAEETPPKEAAEEKPAKPEETPRRSDGKFAKRETKAPEGETKPAKSETVAPKTETPPEKLPAPELRKAYQELKAKHAALETEHNTLKAKAAGPPKEDPEKKTLQERAVALQKRLDEYEENMRFVNYERSDDYREKYLKPFTDAYSAGRARAASLTVQGENEETRQGKPEDFDTIMRITDDDVAAERAQEMFGAKAAMVLFHRERVQELNNARIKAIDEYATKGVEREKLLREKSDTEMKAVSETFVKTRDSAVEKYPQWFKPEDGDEKGNELLTKGFEMADRAFSAEAKKSMSAADLAALHATIRNKAGGFDRLALKLARAQKQIKELSDKLAEIESSAPGEGDGKRAGSGAQPEGWEAQLEKLAT